MAATGVFFIQSTANAPSAQATVTERLRSAFTAEPVLVGRWALEHKLMRDTPSCVPTSANISQKPLQPRYMQFLYLSHYPSHGFIYASESAEIASTLAVPTTSAQPSNATNHPAAPVSAGSQSSPRPSVEAREYSYPMIMSTVPLLSYGALFQHFVYACQPLWCHRHTVAVLGGPVYDVGDFCVRVGEVRQMFPTAKIRGTVVEVEWKGPSLLSSIPSYPVLRHRNVDREINGIASKNSHMASKDGCPRQTDHFGIEISPASIEDVDINAELASTAQLIHDFWSRLGIEASREAVVVPEMGKEVKDRLRLWKQTDTEKLHTARKTETDGWQQNEDPDAGVDLARQYVEIFRFNR